MYQLLRCGKEPLGLVITLLSTGVYLSDLDLELRALGSTARVCTCLS